MNKLINYFRFRWALYCFGFLFIGIFYVVCFLYDGIIDAMQYASLLCMSLLLIYFIIDFYLFSKKRQRLNYLLSLDNILVSELPKVSSSIEQCYQDLFYKFDELHKSMKRQLDHDYYDSLDYFTLWVHQIKTPISALRLLIQSEEATQNDLIMQVLRIEQYVDMALHYIKINHMASDLKIKVYDLSNIMNEEIKKQATFFIQKKIKLELEPIDLQIITDEKWISFVLEQVLSNALKYTKEGTIHIYTKGTTLYIQDTGIGIKKEDLPRVFEKGFTGYNGRVDKKASGLGLYLCKRVIDNLGYTIVIESQVGMGTIVSIDFYKKELQVE